MASIDELYTDGYYIELSISKNALVDIWYGRQIHPDITARYSIFKIRGHIKQTQSEWKREELLAKNTGKGLHTGFIDVVNLIEELIAYVGIIRLRSFTIHSRTDEFCRSHKIASICQKGLVKAIFKEIKNVINDKTFLIDDP